MAYGDYIGRLVADFPKSMTEIDDFAKKIGIKTDNLTIFGIDIYADENDPDRPGNIPPKIKISLLAVNENVWKSKYENFGEYWKNNKVLKAIKIRTDVDLFELYGGYLKRFEGRLVWKSLNNHKIEIEGE